MTRNEMTAYLVQARDAAPPSTDMAVGIAFVAVIILVGLFLAYK